MAIRMMTSNPNQPNVETITDYPGCETWKISHHWDCPHKADPNHYREKGPQCTDRCNHYDPLYIHTTHVGCVIEKYERNGYDDSDFVAVVWDEESQSVQHIEYATTRGWTYCNSATVDVTPENLAKAEAYMRAKAFQRWKDDNLKQAEMPYKGRLVKVIKGRKVKPGTTGEVFWFGEDQYKAAQRNRYNRYNPYAGLVGKYFKDRYRIGIKWSDAKGEHKEFVSAENVEVINPQSYLIPDDVGLKEVTNSCVYYRGY